MSIFTFHTLHYPTLLTGVDIAGLHVVCWIATEGGQWPTSASASSRHGFMAAAALELPSATDSGSFFAWSPASQTDLDLELCQTVSNTARHSYYLFS